jgi:perosamine synthetase
VRLATQYTREERDRIVAGMRRHDIGTSDYFPCIHLQRHYREMFGYKPGDFPGAESVSARTIALPFHNALTAREVDFVAQTLDLMIARENIKHR